MVWSKKRRDKVRRRRVLALLVAAFISGSMLCRMKSGGSFQEGYNSNTNISKKQALWLADNEELETLAPFRSETNLENDLQCYRDQPARRHIHFVHMRKAGGTHLAYTLEKEQRKAGGEETHFFHSEGLTFNVSCFGNDDQDHGGMIHLTSLRDPLQRIISSYFYEGRYNLSDPRLYNLQQQQPSRAAFSRKPIEFKAYVSWLLEKDASKDSELYRRNRVWQNVNNYYIKTLVNRYRPNTTAPIGQEDFELAKRILASFHMVVITEWMDKAEHLVYFNAVLGTTASVFRQKSYVMDAEKQVKNMDWIDEETLRLLRELNRWDIALYDFAMALTKARMVRETLINAGRQLKVLQKCPRSYPEDLLLSRFCPKCMKPRHLQEDRIDRAKVVVLRG